MALFARAFSERILLPLYHPSLLSCRLRKLRKSHNVRVSLFFRPRLFLPLSYYRPAQCPKVCCSLQSHCLSSAVSFCVCTSSPALPTAAYPHRPRPSRPRAKRLHHRARFYLFSFFSPPFLLLPSPGVCGSCKGEMLNCRKCPRCCTGLRNVSRRGVASTRISVARFRGSTFSA